MRSLRPLVTAMMVLALTAACGGSSGTSAASPSTTATPSAVAGGSTKLDPQVAAPPDFPSDVPIYPGARLTAAAKFSSNGPTTWGMEWETTDAVERVHTFYVGKLAQGDWTVQFSGATGTSFSAVFNRKSNTKSTGILGADGSSGVTKISLSLVNA